MLNLHYFLSSKIFLELPGWTFVVVLVLSVSNFRVMHVFPITDDKFVDLNHRVGCSSQLQGRDSSNFNLFASVTSAGFSGYFTYTYLTTTHEAVSCTNTLHFTNG